MLHSRIKTAGPVARVLVQAQTGSVIGMNAVENNALLSQKGRPYLSREGQALFDRILKQGRFKTSEAFDQDYAACGQNTQCIAKVDRAVKAEQARFIEFARTDITDGKQRELLITEFQKAMDAGLFQGSRHVQKFAPGWTAYGEMAAFPQLWYEDAQYRNYRQRGLSDAEARSEVAYQAAGHQLVEGLMLGNGRGVGAALKGTSSSKASPPAKTAAPTVNRQPSPTDGEVSYPTVSLPARQGLTSRGASIEYVPRGTKLQAQQDFDAFKPLNVSTTKDGKVTIGTLSNGDTIKLRPSNDGGRNRVTIEIRNAKGRVLREIRYGNQ